MRQRTWNTTGSRPDKQKTPLSRGFPPRAKARLLQLELDPLLDGMIVARKYRDRDIPAPGILRAPTLDELSGLLRLDQLVLETLREHPRLAPAPHFLARLVEHDELVRLAARKPKLDHPRRVVPDIELELHLTPRMNRKRRAQLRRRLRIGRRRKGLLVTGRPLRKCDRGGTKERNYEAICHHGQATSARATGYITNFFSEAGATYQQVDDRAILK